MMRDLDKALADIFVIRSQIAAGTAFRGYGPATVAATGGFALLTTLFQFLLLVETTRHPPAFFSGWGADALLAGAMVLVEMVVPSRRHQSGPLARTILPLL